MKTIDLLRKMMTSDGKAEVIRLLSDYVDSAEATQRGIDKIKPSMDRIVEGKMEELDVVIKNIAQQVSTLLKIQKQQSVTMANLSLIVMMYMSSGEFDTAVAHAMNKAGHGKEAVQTMFKNKMRGR